MKPRFVLATIALDRMAGGLEKNLAYLANQLAALGLDVSLATFDRETATAFYRLDPRIKWHKLGRSAPHGKIGFWERLRLMGRIRKILRGSRGGTTVVCFHHGILIRFWAAALFTGARLICSERNSLSLYNFIKRSKWNLNFFMLLFCRRITVQFPSYKKDYPWLMRRKLAVVHNPVFPWDRPPAPARKKIIFSAGRHEHQKQFDLLARACALVFEKHPDWRLVIAGDGDLKQRTVEVIQANRLQDKVILLEPVKDLYPYLAEASLYCQPSLWEGFPNALAEAMAAGAVPVGFAATSGVADLIEDGVNGYLCPGGFSAQNLAQTLIRAMEDRENHPRLSARASLVTEQYSPASWIAAWREVLEI